MNRRDFNMVLGAAAIAPAGLAAAQEGGAAVDWSLEANVAECCSCEIPCPCNFGRPTSMRCDGNRLIEITKGHVGDADLAGVRFLATFEMGKWTRIYVDDSLSAAQNKAVDAILPLAFGGFFNGARSIERVPMTVERTDELISYTTPASSVEMKPMVGLDGGRISISGLPSVVFHDYVQYESVMHTHESPERQWSHSGTNGFTSRMIASS
ncbi:MAG: DUF1326 domain-containing protein [Woeseiaceae bacterium]